MLSCTGKQVRNTDPQEGSYREPLGLRRGAEQALHKNGYAKVFGIAIALSPLGVTPISRVRSPAISSLVTLSHETPSMGFLSDLGLRFAAEPDQARNPKPKA